jgi:uncharacterized protein (UPF0332 family)
MSQDHIIDYWMEKAHDDLGLARDNFKSERYSNAVRDAYFACFHAFSAILIETDQVKEIIAQSEEFVRQMSEYLTRHAET